MSSLEFLSLSDPISNSGKVLRIKDFDILRSELELRATDHLLQFTIGSKYLVFEIFHIETTAFDLGFEKLIIALSFKALPKLTPHHSELSLEKLHFSAGCGALPLEAANGGISFKHVQCERLSCARGFEIGLLPTQSAASEFVPTLAAIIKALPEHQCARRLPTLAPSVGHRRLKAQMRKKFCARFDPRRLRLIRSELGLYRRKPTFISGTHEVPQAPGGRLLGFERTHPQRHR